MASSLHFLIQSMKSHEHLFLNTISWIFPLKSTLLVFLTIALSFFLSKSDLDVQHKFKTLLYLLFHQDLECLVILTHLEYFPKIVCNKCEFLYYSSKYITVSHKQSINIAHIVLEFIDKAFLFSNNGPLFVLDELFTNDDVDCQMGMIRQFS